MVRRTKQKHTFYFALPVLSDDAFTSSRGHGDGMTEYHLTEFGEVLIRQAERQYADAANERFGEGNWLATDFAVDPVMAENVSWSVRDEWEIHLPHAYIASVNIWADEGDDSGRGLHIVSPPGDDR